MAKFVPVVVSPETLEALDAEHDGVLHFQGTDIAPFCYVLRRPTAGELTSYQGALKTRGILASNRLFLRALCVYPSAGDVDRQVDRWPASAGACLTSDRFTEFSGGVISDHQK